MSRVPPSPAVLSIGAEVTARMFARAEILAGVLEGGSRLAKVPAVESKAAAVTAPAIPTERRRSSSTPASLSRDLDLMSRVAQGDRDAQRDCVIRLRPRVHRVAASLLRGNADTDDLVQSTLIEILKSAHSFRANSSLERWSDRIVVRRAMRVLRKRRVMLTREDCEFDLESVADDSVLSDERDNVAKPVEEYLAQLPEPLRTVLVLRHALEYSIQEIADLTASSPNTAKKRLVRANQLFRRMIRRDWLGPSLGHAPEHPADEAQGGGGRR